MINERILVNMHILVLPILGTPLKEKSTFYILLNGENCKSKNAKNKSFEAEKDDLKMKIGFDHFSE